MARSRQHIAVKRITEALDTAEWNPAELVMQMSDIPLFVRQRLLGLFLSLIDFWAERHTMNVASTVAEQEFFRDCHRLQRGISRWRVE